MAKLAPPMHHYMKHLVIIAAAAAVLAGCGGAAEPSTTSGPATPTTSARATTKPKTKRAKVKDCLESVGYATERPNDSTDMMRVKSGGGQLTAVLLWLKSANAAKGDSSRARTEDGLESASFGQVEMNYFNKAANPHSAQARVITDCVSREYAAR
jgi:hypothetical protein